MSWEDDLRADLVRDEGRKLEPYPDTVGKLTIGVGRNLTDNGVSVDESDLMQFNDTQTAKRMLSQMFPWWVTRPDVVKRGLVNMCYNLGVTRLALFDRMLSALQAGDYDTAANEALNSKWAEQVGQRAVRVAELFRSAVDIKIA